MARKKTDHTPESAPTLRQRAEARVASRRRPAQADEQDIAALLHELEVHQAELEIQNEELRSTQVDLATARDRYLDLFEFAPVGYLTLTADRRVREANLTAVAMLGVERSKLIGQSLAKFVSLDSQADLRDHFTMDFAVPEKRTLRLRFHGPDHSTFVGQLESVPAGAEDGPVSERRIALIDVTALVKAEEAQQACELSLRRSVEEAQAANAAKSQFLANMSHELRTPMNSVLGMMNLALLESPSPAVRDYLQTAQDAGNALLTLVNDILDFSRIEAGGMQLDTVEFSLREVMDKTLKPLGHRAEQKGLELRCDLAPDVPDRLLGDPHRLRQVLTNLVDNAVKFTEEGEILVRVEECRSQISDCRSQVCNLQFAVSDTGIGISREDQERIFTPFTQADASTTRRHGGTGLGLTISQRLVKLMGGELEMESRPGRGSRFYFTLPLGKGKGDEGRGARDEGRGMTDETLSSLIPHPSPLVPRPSSLDSLPRTDRPLRVLLAEDTPGNQKVALAILGKRGHSVQIARNGQQALEMLSRHDFDVVLMDVQMPVLDGYQAVAAIRAMPHTTKARVPIIAMTAHALKGDAERCLAAGMDAYLSKPVDLQEMVETVERWGGWGTGDGGRGTGDGGKAQEPMANDQTVLGHSPLDLGHSSASPAPRPPSPVFDLDDAVSKCFGRLKMFQDMVECLFEEADPLLKQMREALGRGGGEEVRDAAHRLKNTVLYLSAPAALEATQRVEHLAREGSLAEAGEAVEDLSRRIAALKEALGPHRKTATPEKELGVRSQESRDANS